MILLTPSQRARLLANGRVPDGDHIPVVKFFNPFGQGTWLATELDEDGDIISVWAEAARAEGSISAAERVLSARAQREGGASFGRRG